MLDAILPTLRNRPSSANRAAALRAEVAESFAEALRFGLQKPAAKGIMSHGRHTNLWGPFRFREHDEEYYGPLPQGLLVHERLADILNSSVPLDLFSRLALEEPTLSDEFRRELILAAWTRAVLLERWELAAKLASAAKTAAPETANSMDEFLAAPPKSRLLQAQLTLLRFHGIGAKVWAGYGRMAPLDALQLDSLNWWLWDDMYGGDWFGPAPPIQTGWTTPEEREQAAEEWKKILALGNGHDWIYGGVAKQCRSASPSPSCPEALYRVEGSIAAITYWKVVAWLHFDKAQLWIGNTSLLTSRFSPSIWARYLEEDLPWPDRRWPAPNNGTKPQPYVYFPH